MKKSRKNIKKNKRNSSRISKFKIYGGMKLNVESYLEGLNVTIDVEPTDTIQSLKSKVIAKIGVEPRNATATSANIRLRISSGDRCWLMLFIAATIAVLAAPSGKLTRYATQMFGDQASAIADTPVAMITPVNHLVVTSRSRAVASEPTTLPILITVSNRPNALA